MKLSRPHAFLTLLLLLAGCGLFSSSPLKEPEAPPPAMTPEAQAARISATILSRRVQKLREEALYIRYREEGRALLEEFFGETEEQEVPRIPNGGDAGS